MKSTEKRIIKINASAGSGKTHNLKLRFLKLLANASLSLTPEKYILKNPLPHVKDTSETTKNHNQTKSLQKYNFSEILALTFTNAAASEMQERIVQTLKKIALDITTEEDKEIKEVWTQENAKDIINQIFKHYNALNIKTIDSLLHHLVRLCTLELEIPPQFNVTFNNDTIIKPVFKTIAQKAREDKELAQLFDEVCQALIDYKSPSSKFLMSESVTNECSKIVENCIREKEKLFYKIYDPQNPYFLKIQELSKDLENNDLTSLDYLCDEIEKLIKKLNESEQEDADAILTPKDELISLFETAKNSMLESAQTMLYYIEHETLLAVENFKKATKALLEGVYKESSYFAKDSLDDCLKSASKNKASKDAYHAYTKLCESILDFYTLNAIMPNALTALPLLELATKIEENVWEYEKEQALILSDRMPALVRKALHDEHYLSTAFCRLGVNLNHILFDEFQDTSTAQWQALAPLAKEALAIHGSVFFVGDIKQAIYGWRGGDASLFKRAPSSLKHSSSEDQITDTTLKENWRSDENIIQWNNAFFEQFTHDILKSAFAESFLLEKAKLLRKQPHLTAEIEESYDACLEKIITAYKDVKQVPAAKKRKKEQKKSLEKQGLVQIHTIKLPKDKVNLGILTLLAPSVQALHDTRKYDWNEICVLTITNKQASLVSEALLSQNIPVVSQGSLFMAEHPIIQEIIACMRFLANPLDEQAFFEVLSSEHLLPLKIDRQILLDFSVEKRKKSLFSLFKETFPQEWDYLFKALVDNAGLLTAYDSLCEMYKRFEIRSRHVKSEVFLLRLLEIVHLAEANKCLDLSSFLDWWDMHGIEEKAPLPKDTGAVSVMTVHKAKGLEFKAVLIPWHNFMVQPDLDSPQKIKYTYKNQKLILFSRLMKEHGRPYFDAYFDKVIESINALYVAWTRAQKELHIFMPEEAPSRDSVFPQFLDAMLLKLTLKQETKDNREAKRITAENIIASNIPLEIETFEDYKSFGGIYDNETNTQNNISIVNPLYLRTLEYLLWKEEVMPQAIQNAREFFNISHIEQNNIDTFNHLSKEELANAKSTDNLFYAKQIDFLFNTFNTSNEKQTKTNKNAHQEKPQTTNKTAHSPACMPTDIGQNMPINPQERPMDWLPRLKIFRNNLSDLYLNQEDEISANKRGTLMHKCLENVVYSGDIINDTKRALNSVFGTPPIQKMNCIPKENALPVNKQAQNMPIHTYQSIDKEKFEKAISWFLSLESPLGGAKEWLKYALKEHALTSKEGKMFRVDLLVNRPPFIRQGSDTIELLAIDYKTGYQGDLPKIENVEQIKNYLELLSESISEGNNNQKNKVLGMLIYLDKEEIHLVEL